MSQVTFQIDGQDGLTQHINGLLDRTKSLKAYLATTVYKQYQQFQLARWKSAGSGDSGITTSEGDHWPGLQKDYLKYKRKKFAGKDYGGNQMLVATGDLLKSVIGPGNGQNLLITNYQLIITTTLNYAKYVSQMRYFGSLGSKSMATIRKGVTEYVKGL